MKIRVFLPFVCLVVLVSCQPIGKSNLTEKRLAAMEDAVNTMAQMQRKQEAMLRRLVIRERNIHKGTQRLNRKQKSGKEWISRLRQIQDQDADRVEELSMVVSKMIDPLRRMHIALSHLSVRMHQLRQQQSELSGHFPNSAKSPAIKEQARKAVQVQEPAGLPIDKKKRRKVLESVAFLRYQAATHA